VGVALLFLTGLGLLIGGAELVVRGASRLATLLGISPMVIGLTIVAIGKTRTETVGLARRVQESRTNREA
jgi:cation:H+ antiporter